MFDVAVIGGGVVGGLLLRQLSKYQLKVCLLEKQADVSMGASRANSGVVHAGFDAKEGTNKAKFNVRGNQMMPSLCEELGVKFKNNGSLVVAFSQDDLETLKDLKARGEKNGVSDLEKVSSWQKVLIDDELYVLTYAYAKLDDETKLETDNEVINAKIKEMSKR